MRKRTNQLLILLIAVLTGAVSCNTPTADDGFVDLFNGENWDGWYLKIRSGDEEMAQKVYAIEDGIVHVFNDEFPETVSVKKIIIMSLREQADN